MTALSIKLSEEQANHLRKMSHYLSLQRNEDLTLSDLVREALEKVYPMETIQNIEMEEHGEKDKL